MTCSSPSPYRRAWQGPKNFPHSPHRQRHQAIGSGRDGAPSSLDCLLPRLPTTELTDLLARTSARWTRGAPSSLDHRVAPSRCPQDARGTKDTVRNALTYYKHTDTGQGQQAWTLHPGIWGEKGLQWSGQTVVPSQRRHGQRAHGQQRLLGTVAPDRRAGWSSKLSKPPMAPAVRDKGFPAVWLRGCCWTDDY